MMVARTGKIAFVLLAALCVAACWEPTEREARWSALGGRGEVRVEIRAVTERDAEAVLEDMQEAFSTIETNMLSGRDAGELGRLNRAAAEEYWPVEDRDLYRCLLLALDYAKASKGAFDPTVGGLMDLYQMTATTPAPSEIEPLLDAVGWQYVAVAEEARSFRFRRPGLSLDLGGVAKGFALDAAARAFARPGSLGGLLQMGGNFYTWGHAAGKQEWTVGLPDPRKPQRVLLEVRLANRGIAISGRGPGRLVLDPGTGLPAAGDLIAAVGIADSAADADALSTALYVSGSLGGADLLSRMKRTEAVLLVEEEKGACYLLASASLRGRLTPSAELLDECDGDIRYLLPPTSF
jgi:thiamine biosynthesis lipoprotein